MNWIRYLMGIIGSLMGLNFFMRCGSSCPLCFGCAGFGLGMAIFAFIKRR